MMGWEKQLASEDVVYIEDEEFESAPPVPGDALTFFKAHKVHHVDKSGGALPVAPKKEKVVPLKAPVVDRIKVAFSKKLKLQLELKKPE